MAKSKAFLYQTTVELTEEQVAALQAGLNGGDLNTAIRNHVNAFLRTYVEGGLMLSKPQLDTIEKVTGHRISLPEEVIQFALEAKGRKGGKYTVSAEVDEAFWANVEETASHSGLTADELLQNLIQYVISEGWLYSWEPSGCTLHFTDADAAYLRSLVGSKTFFGSDLVKAIKAAMPKQKELVGA